MVGSALAWWVTDEVLISKIARRGLSASLRTLVYMFLGGGIFLWSTSQPTSSAGVAIYLGWCVILFLLLRRRLPQLSRLRTLAPVLDHASH